MTITHEEALALVGCDLEHDEYVALREYIRAVDAATRWRPILPIDIAIMGRFVLLRVGPLIGKPYVIIGRVDCDGNAKDVFGASVRATHWMHLPSTEIP